MRNFVIAMSLALALPVAAAAQTAGTPPIAPGAGSGNTAPSGVDTPMAKVPGTVRAEPPNQTPPLPTVDSSGANRSNDSATGEPRPPIGAPRLPGEPANPPTGPND